MGRLLNDKEILYFLASLKRYDKKRYIDNIKIYELKHSGKDFISYYISFGKNENVIDGTVVKILYEFAYKFGYWIWGVSYKQDLGVCIKVTEINEIDPKSEAEEKVEEERQKELSFEEEEAKIEQEYLIRG